MRRPLLTIVLAVTALAVGVGGVLAWRALRVEDIPEQLEALEPAATQVAEAPLVIPGDGDLPDFRVEDQAGKTVFLVVEGMASMRSGEGRALGRALNRWTFPDTTAGFMVGDAEGFGMFRAKAQEFMGAMRAEFRFPLYVDFDGATTGAFKLPKGHSGLVILDETGNVALRKSGALEDAALEEVRLLLGAREPEPGPPAPPFEVGDLNRETCLGTTCVLAFLGKALTRADVPGVDRGFEGKGKEAQAHLARPEVRLASAVAKMKPKAGVRGVVIGQIHDLELEGWATAPAGEGLGKPFDIADDQTAIVVLDPQGRIQFDARGVIRMYQWDRVAEILGVDPDRGWARGPDAAGKDGGPG